VTFKDVPIGHIFQFMHCNCVLRRTSPEIAELVSACRDHRIGTGPMQYKLEQWEVRYDPLVAMLEEQK